MCSKQGCKTERKPLVCKWCSVVFVPQGRGPQKFCSAECSQSNKASVAAEINSQRFAMLPKCATDHCQAKVWQSGQTHCKVCLKRAEQTGSVEKFIACAGGCGKSIDRIAKRSLYCDKCFKAENRRLGEQRRTRTCEVCGKAFLKSYTSSTAGRACSRECGFKLLAIDASKKFGSEWIRKDNERASTLVASLKPCPVCGWHFVSNASDCGRPGCRKENNRRKAIASWYGSYEAWLNKPCDDCGQLVEVGKYKGRYCNACRKVRQRAARAIASAKRRRLQNGVTSPDAPRSILKGIADMIRKAGHKCSLCGLMMTKGCDPNHDRYIELDHKVPLSRGGTDTFDNLQAICRKCNGLKSAFTSVDVVLTPSPDELHNS